MSIDSNRRQTLKVIGATLLPVLPEYCHANNLDIGGNTMGTHYRVKIPDANLDRSAASMEVQIRQILDDTESSMSLYKLNSEINQINASTKTDWMAISSAMTRVVSEALRIENLSKGRFNVATAPLVKYWGFGPEPSVVAEPSAPIPNKLLTVVAQSNFQISEQGIRKARPGTALDLNGIAKGDAIDQIGKMLERHDISNYLVEIGGEIRVSGSGMNGSGWHIGLEHPGGGLFDTVLLNNQAVATSGDYTDFYLKNGKRYSHLIDPVTGRPIDHDLAMVSVIANTAMEADAWATALNVMGLTDGYEFALSHSLPAAFAKRESDGYGLRMTPDFQKLLFRENGVNT